MRFVLAVMALALLPTLHAWRAHAQTASLLADRIEVQAAGGIRASGYVEVIFGTTRLTAAAISYDGRTRKLTVEGPIVLTDETGQSILLADAAELDADLRNGILEGARMILDGRLQMAAAEIARVEARFTRLARVVASSCRVCPANPVPLWQIRADSVIHDQELSRIFFERAVLEVAGLPVFYLPRLAVPDPTQTRATGFLVPKLRSSALLGTTIEAPYFIAIGDSRDLTVTPLLSSETTTVKLRYRQAFRTGGVTLNGAVTNDRLLADATRGYLFAEGRFRLPGAADLEFDFKFASDPTYLATYDVTQATKLDSRVRVTRTDADAHSTAEVAAFRILSGAEAGYADLVPRLTARFEHQRRMRAAPLGGTALWSLTADTHLRDSGLDGPGRDMARAGAGLSWSRVGVLAGGLVARAEGRGGIDAYLIAQESGYDRNVLRTNLGGAAELRWPLARPNAQGGTDVIEPVLHLGWSDASGGAVPNEDSRTAALEEVNLFDINRFAGEDRIETGLRAAAGLLWSRHGGTGWNGRVAAGLVHTDRPAAGFSPSSGLSGKLSDLLLAGQFTLGQRLSADGQMLLGRDGGMTSADLRLNWQSRRTLLSARHSWAQADPSLNRPGPVAEIDLDGSYQINGNWAVSGSLLYDLDIARSVQNRIRLEYRNECVLVDLSASRRFKSSANVIADTDFGIEVQLIGFGSGRGGPPAACG